MVLSRPDILKRIESRSITFTPELPPEAIKQVSVDLRLGRRFSTFKKPKHAAAIEITPEILLEADLWDDQEGDHFYLVRNEFVLAQTLERVTLPNDLMGMVEGRSSWARLGISIHVTAPKIDPGFRGTITLELTNHGKTDVRLVAGTHTPCQLMFFALSTPLNPSECYGSGTGDIFHNQTTPVPHRS